MASNKYKILIVDDHDYNLISHQIMLEKWGYDVDTAKSGDEAIEKLKRTDVEYALVLLDYRMPNKDGAQVAREIRSFNTETFILIYSGDDSREAIKDSWAAGAVGFLEKNCPEEILRQAVENNCCKYEETARTLKVQQPSSTNEKLIRTLGMVGRSTAMAEVALSVTRYRGSGDSVLIIGETGVGKEGVARAVHAGPPDKFRAINCAAYGDNNHLLDSELFGYERGAFTGAQGGGKIGILESARGGTVFFDEIHRLSPSAQGQLLRAIQEKKIRRVGGNLEYPVDFRIVAAGKPNLEQLAEEGSFLPDLFYRLNVLTINIPPLRDRREDVAPLIAHFCDLYFKKTGKRKSFLMKTVRYLENYCWPGNIRELENTVKRILTNSDQSTIDPKQLDSKFFSSSETLLGVSTFAELEHRQEREKRAFLSNALTTSKNAAQAASRLGLPTSTMYDLMTKYGLKKNRELHDEVAH